MKKKNILVALLLSGCIVMPTVKANDASLRYEGDAEQFIQTNDTTDAFMNMMPGEERSQIISLTNDNHEAMKFFVKVDEATLLNEGINGSIVYDITFKNDGKVFYTGRIGGSSKVSKGNLTEEYLLRDLKKGESTQIEMSIKIDGTSMSNEYQGTTGNLGIVFSVEPTDKNEVIEIVKKIPVINKLPGVSTGDVTSIYSLLFITLLSIGIIVLVILKKRKDDENETA